MQNNVEDLTQSKDSKAKRIDVLDEENSRLVRNYCVCLELHPQLDITRVLWFYQTPRIFPVRVIPFSY